MYKLSTITGIIGLFVWLDVRCLANIANNLQLPLPLAQLELMDTNICVAHVSLALSRNTIRRTEENPLEMVKCDGALLRDSFYFRTSDADIDDSKVPEAAENIYYRTFIKAESKSDFWAWSPSKIFTTERKNVQNGGGEPSYVASNAERQRYLLRTYISPGFRPAIPGTIKWTGSNTFYCKVQSERSSEATGSVVWSATNAYTVTAYRSGMNSPLQEPLWKSRVQILSAAASSRAFNAEYDHCQEFMLETGLILEKWQERIEVRMVELADCAKVDRDFLPTDLIPHPEQATAILVVTNGIRNELQVDGSLKAVDTSDSSMGSERRFRKILVLVPVASLLLIILAARRLQKSRLRSAGEKEKQ